MAVKVIEKACDGPFKVEYGALQPLGLCREVVRMEVPEGDEHGFAAKILNAIGSNVRCDSCTNQGRKLMTDYNRRLEEVRTGRKPKSSKSKAKLIKYQ